MDNPVCFRAQKVSKSNTCIMSHLSMTIQKINSTVMWEIVIRVQIVHCWNILSSCTSLPACCDQSGAQNVTDRRHWGTVHTICHMVPVRQDSLHCVRLEDWRRLCWPAQIAQWIPPKWELFTRTLWSVLRHCLHDTAQREMCLLRGALLFSTVHC